MHEPKLGIWDFLAVAGYFSAVIGAGIFVSITCMVVRTGLWHLAHRFQ